jgi:glycosyltransferase involved in cell wall biosynthesis
MKDVTIIIPSYVVDDKTYGWLVESVASALDQMVHVIVYDDGSPYKVVNKLIKEFSRSDLYVFGSDENHGVSYARNRATEKVETTLFIPLDCDDKFGEDAIEKLHLIWDGVPVYSDLSKFGNEHIIHFRLLDFDCKMLKEKLGIAPVSVLHSIEQWKTLGGWNEDINLYEDAEYNARLLGTYCGKNVHEPLIMYRQHDLQRTKKYDAISRNISKNILDMVRRYDMPCSSCGGARRSQMVKNNSFSSSIPNVLPLQSRIDNMPGSQGELVLAHYVGGAGKMTHYYRGVVTNYPYKVMYDSLLYVDVRDTSEPDSLNKKSFLLRVNKSDTSTTTTAPVVEVSAIVPADVIIDTATVKRVSVAFVEKVPIVDLDKVAINDDIDYLPDIANLSVRAIRNLDIDEEVARKLLKIETFGLNRERVIEWLNNRLK